MEKKEKIQFFFDYTSSFIHIHCRYHKNGKVNELLSRHINNSLNEKKIRVKC